MDRLVHGFTKNKGVLRPCNWMIYTVESLWIIIKHPRNRGKFDSDEAVTIELNNPTCGDKISLQMQVEDGIVRMLNL